MTHCDYVSMSTVRVFCWLMTCALSIFSVLDNFCQIAPLHSNAVWMTRVLHLICKAQTHILIFGSKFYILAMYVQMLDIYRKYRGKMWFFFNIFENITIFSNPGFTQNAFPKELSSSLCGTPDWLSTFCSRCSTTWSESVTILAIFKNTSTGLTWC